MTDPSEMALQYWELLSRPDCFGPCCACGGSGFSGEFEVHEGRATWDDPGFYEIDAVPCSVCGGTGREEVARDV